MRTKSAQKAWEAMIHHVNYFWKKRYEAEKNDAPKTGK